MTNTIPQDDRAAFEEKYSSCDLSRIGDSYKIAYVDRMWEGWQACAQLRDARKCEADNDASPTPNVEPVAWRNKENGWLCNEQELEDDEPLYTHPAPPQAELQRELGLYRKALIDLSQRGHGVKRPKWLIEAIDKARGE